MAPEVTAHRSDPRLDIWRGTRQGKRQGEVDAADPPSCLHLHRNEQDVTLGTARVAIIKTFPEM